jgi:HEXXH motif-containing protein
MTGGWRIDCDETIRAVEFGPRALRFFARATSDAEAITIDPRAVPIRDAGPVRIADAFVPIVGDVKLALADVNPLASVQLHPERAGNVIDFGGRTLHEWLGPLRGAFAIIEKYLPPIYDEMQLLLRTVVPVGYLPERHASCSYEDALGSIYLTLHPNPLKIAEALVHEFQHNKLHALMRLDAVLTNARTSRHRSPVRPDPRPLEGVLLAVHAFIPVAMMYRAMTAASDPLSKSRDWGATCEAAERVYREGADTLYAHGEPTKTGRALLDEMRGLMARMDGAE